MRRAFSITALVVTLASPSWAQQTTASDPQAQETRAKVADKKFWLVAAALNGAMIMDTKSTFDVDRRCANCVETNPYAAPFVNRGPAVTFTAAETFDMGVMFIAFKMKGSERPQVRNVWWVMPVALTAGHVAAYRHNLKVGQVK
jgi:hypothetical protein